MPSGRPWKRKTSGIQASERQEILYGRTIDQNSVSGIVAAATVATGAISGFGFSAGLVDLMISLPIAAQISHGIAGGYSHLG